MKKSKQQRNRQRHDFLLTLFPDGSQYTEKEMNGFWLVKYFSKGTHKWEVSIFTKESFKRYKEYNDRIQTQDKKVGQLFDTVT